MAKEQELHLRLSTPANVRPAFRFTREVTTWLYVAVENLNIETWLNQNESVDMDSDKSPVPRLRPCKCSTRGGLTTIANSCIYAESNEFLMSFSIVTKRIFS